LKTQYNNCKNLEEAILNKESFYYWIRKCYNSISGDDKKNVKCSAMLVFLNKTCFRGLYRVGFNVPHGNYKNPEIINKEHLDVMNDLIKNVNFIVSDF
jgi:DNA adenine methylase